MKKKSDIITFKVDDTLLEAMEGIPNRSQFIRTAILAALDSSCPLCKGTGILTPNQHRHWEDFLVDHSVQACEKCNELHLVCGGPRAGHADKTVHH
jgi:hypothetical protein